MGYQGMPTTTMFMATGTKKASRYVKKETKPPKRDWLSVILIGLVIIFLIAAVLGNVWLPAIIVLGLFLYWTYFIFSSL